MRLFVQPKVHLAGIAFLADITLEDVCCVGCKFVVAELVLRWEAVKEGRVMSDQAAGEYGILTIYYRPRIYSLSSCALTPCDD